MLLALYDGALARLDKAAMALTNGDVPVATPYIAKAQLIVSELAAGVRVEVDEEMGTNMLRLYEYVVNELRTPRLANVGNAKKILTRPAGGVRGHPRRGQQAGEDRRTGGRRPDADGARNGVIRQALAAHSRHNSDGFADSARRRRESI